jgi:hypothetical protein
MIVQQADRDAAAALLEAFGRPHRYVTCVRNGEHDDGPTCQAFARHRTEAISSVLAEKERLEKALLQERADYAKRAEEWARDTNHYDVRAEAAEAKLASILSPENVEKAARAIQQSERDMGKHLVGWDALGPQTQAHLRFAARAALASIGEGRGQ